MNTKKKVQATSEWTLWSRNWWMNTTKNKQLVNEHCEAQATGKAGFTVLVMATLQQFLSRNIPNAFLFMVLGGTALMIW